MPGGWFPVPDDAAPRMPHHAHVQRGTVVLLLDSEGVYARRVTWRQRLQARLLGDRLDRELASGVRPETDPVLMLRAARISSPRSRRELASLVRRLLDSALETRDTRFAAQSMVLLPRVRKARREFEELLECLEAPAPLPARGMAAVMLLLRDGSGPLYRAESRQSLARMVRDITGQLDPALDWSLG